MLLLLRSYVHHYIQSMWYWYWSIRLSTHVSICVTIHLCFYFPTLLMVFFPSLLIWQNIPSFLCTFSHLFFAHQWHTSIFLSPLYLVENEWDIEPKSCSVWRQRMLNIARSPYLNFIFVWLVCKVSYEVLLLRSIFHQIVTLVPSCPAEKLNIIPVILTLYPMLALWNIPLKLYLTK